MSDNLRILCTGQFKPSQPIAWHLAPLPVPQVSSDDPDAVFDEPCGISFFEHLVPEQPVDGLLQEMVDVANADLLAEEWQWHWIDEEREFPR